MCVHLGLQEALNKNLEQRLVRLETDFIFAFGTIKAKTASLAASEHHNANKTLLDQRLAESHECSALN